MNQNFVSYKYPIQFQSSSSTRSFLKSKTNSDINNEI